MKIIIGIFLLIFFILLLPLTFKGKISYNIFNNYGYISLFFFSIKLCLLKIKILPFKIRFKTNKKKFYLTFSSFISEDNFGEVFLNTLLKFIKFKSIKFFTNMSIKDNAYFPYLIAGTLYILFGTFYSYYSLSKNFYNVECLNFANFTNTNFVINLTCSVKVSLLIIIICFFISVFKNLKREVKN